MLFGAPRRDHNGNLRDIRVTFAMPTVRSGYFGTRCGGGGVVVVVAVVTETEGQRMR